MQTGLHASTAKSFAVQKTIAEQVRAFMEAKADASGTPFRPADMAALVAAHQSGLEEKAQCKRQDIEGLLKKDFRTVRYLPALAAAMGVAVEDLVAGTAQAPSAIHAEPEAMAPSSLSRRREDRLAEALRIVGASFRDAGEKQRALAKPYLEMVLNNYDATAADNIPILLKHLLGGVQAQSDEPTRRRVNET